MKILTWNIDNSEVDIKQRMELFVDILNTEEPDIICLQEVTKKAYNYLTTNTQYLYTNYNEEFSYVTIIGVKSTVISEGTIIIKLTSSMNREAIWCRTKDFDLVTFHLESSPINSELRKHQIKEILNNKFTDKVIMCGDTNFILQNEGFETDDIQFNGSFVDYSPKEPSYNYLENRRVLGPYISYLDRVFAKDIRIQKSHLIKNDKISDHFGIIFVL